jgi:voltage-gated potassium channel
VIIFGSAMYFIEGADSGFTSIPRSVYWAIVTLTTVGFGDIAPMTPVGQIVAVMIMVLGYGIIAVPTGIVTAGLVETTRTGETAPARSVTRRTCDTCEKGGHSRDARFCCYCSMELPL